jgi:hypothetical protein
MNKVRITPRPEEKDAPDTIPTQSTEEKYAAIKICSNKNMQQ